MRLTKLSGYAVRVAVECALSGADLAKTSDIAKRNHITKYNLSKTIAILVRHGIIEAVRGRNGGIRLARPATDISLGEIIRATEETVLVAECSGAGATDCPVREATPVNQILDSALVAFIDVLDQHSVADLIKHRPPRGKTSSKSFPDENSEKLEPACADFMHFLP